MYIDVDDDDETLKSAKLLELCKLVLVGFIYSPAACGCLAASFSEGCAVDAPVPSKLVLILPTSEGCQAE